MAKSLIILTDEQSEFLVSKPNPLGYTSMDVKRIENYFKIRNFAVRVCKFSKLDLRDDFRGTFVLYQSSETPGSFYKRYIENIIYYLENKGAIVLPEYKYLKAHHDKVSMELLRSGFSDIKLKTLESKPYGSWVDALNYDSLFPVVVKACSSSASAGVYFARNKSEYDRIVRRAGKVIFARGIADLFAGWFKTSFKRLVKLIDPSKKKYYWKYGTNPLSMPLVVQPFVDGLEGDFKVLFFGGKYFSMFRKNRKNDFRASGSGNFLVVPDNEFPGLLNFARKVTAQINFPIIGMDIGFDGKDYHLIEFQMIDMGASALQRSEFWHEFRDGHLIRFDGKSDLEEEFSRSILTFITGH